MSDFAYDYVFLDLQAPAGAPPARGLIEHIRAQTPKLAAAGGEVLGLFTPQLGWHGSQAALLVAWRSDAQQRESALGDLLATPTVRRSVHDRARPTARPAAGDKPRAGGIYVHRWFVVEPGALPEFVSLSTQGWKDFEARFDTNIFGLFEVERTRDDEAAGVTRLLLTTRYADHGVWEASRDPTTEAMAAFARRRLLTRDTWAASTLLATI